MKVDTSIPTNPRDAPAEVARAAEAIGFDGLHAAETAHDPFIALTLAAAATDRVELMTSVAIAFARSPTSMAQTGWDLAALSKGRFVLGLGTQVKAHVERRFAMPWAPPVPRLREYVGLIRAVWDSWRDGTPLAFTGVHYRASLMTPFFNPGPIDHSHPPIYLAGVAPPLLRLTGEVADGLAVHPLHTVSYLREVVRPAVAAGAARAKRPTGSCQLSVPVFAITGRDAIEREQTRGRVRSQIAFYASTPSYAPVFEHHGWGDVRKELTALAARRAWNEMPAMIDETILREFAIDAEPGDIGAALRERYGGLADRITLYQRFEPGHDDLFWRELIRALQE